MVIYATICTQTIASRSSKPGRADYTQSQSQGVFGRHPLLDNRDISAYQTEKILLYQINLVKLLVTWSDFKLEDRVDL